jgi:hypothetical protein
MERVKVALIACASLMVAFAGLSSVLYMKLQYPEGNIILGGEKLTFIEGKWDEAVSFGGPIYYDCFELKCRNSGSESLSIVEARVDGETAHVSELTDPYVLYSGSSVTLWIWGPEFHYVNGTSYEFTVLTAKGNLFGPYTATTPS